MHLWVPNLTESCTIGPKRHWSTFFQRGRANMVSTLFWWEVWHQRGGRSLQFCPFSAFKFHITVTIFYLSLSLSLSLSIVPPRYLKHLSGPLHPYRPFHSDPPHGGRIHLTGPKSFERRWAPTHHLHRVRFEDGGETQISATMECRTNLLLLPIA